MAVMLHDPRSTSLDRAKELYIYKPGNDFLLLHVVPDY